MLRPLLTICASPLLRHSCCCQPGWDPARSEPLPAPRGPCSDCVVHVTVRSLNRPGQKHRQTGLDWHGNAPRFPDRSGSRIAMSAVVIIVGTRTEESSASGARSSAFGSMACQICASQTFREFPLIAEQQVKIPIITWLGWPSTRPQCRP